eukprot:6057058-Prymnesium_polylepis.1
MWENVGPMPKSRTRALNKRLSTSLNKYDKLVQSFEKKVREYKLDQKIRFTGAEWKAFDVPQLERNSYIEVDTDAGKECFVPREDPNLFYRYKSYRASDGENEDHFFGRKSPVGTLYSTKSDGSDRLDDSVSNVSSSHQSSGVPDNSSADAGAGVFSRDSRVSWADKDAAAGAKSMH